MHRVPIHCLKLGPAAAVLLCVATTPAATADSQAPGNGAWDTLRPQLYGTRDIGENGDQLMSVEAPGSTPDPSATPVVVHFGAGLEGKVKEVRVIIDNNPSPLVATMELAQGLPVEEIDLRVRIDRYTSVRAIAETADGKLEMRSTWVNASGGCSAPSAATEGEVLGRSASIPRRTRTRCSSASGIRTIRDSRSTRRRAIRFHRTSYRTSG